MVSAHPSILIVGAGPAGLVLVLSLLQNGIPVRIIAKEQEFRLGQRAPGVMPRTLKLHNMLKTLPDVLEKARPAQPIRKYKLPGGTEVLEEYDVMTLVEPTPDTPYSTGLMLGQSTHEALLRAHLSKRTIMLLKGDGTIDIETKEYKWLIGADGGRSTVRKSLKDVSFLGETRGLNTLASVQDSFNLSWKLALVEKGLASPDLLNSYNTERLPVVTEMLNVSTALLDKTFTVNGGEGDCEAFVRGGVLYQFSVNYRHSNIIVDERTSAEDKEANRSAYTIDFSKPVHAGDRVLDAPGLVSKVEEKTTRIFEIIGSAFHTVFVFTPDADVAIQVLLNSAVEQYPSGSLKLVVISPAGTPAFKVSGVSLQDCDGHAFKGYKIEGQKPSIVVVRPDGVVGAIIFGVEGLQAYFKWIFI